jgi:Tol biopolymer transport system component
MSSGSAYYGPPRRVLTGYWPTSNFSPGGHRIQYFAGHASDPTAAPYHGKYRVMDLRTGQSYRLFPGADDNAAPGYGYLAWGPAGSNLIAYTNSANGIRVNPRCVYLMRPDGSERRQLWCAPDHQSTPQGSVPTRAVEAIRWAGNGKSLLAYVTYYRKPLSLAGARPAQADPFGSTGYAALFKVDVPTGAARKIAPNIFAPESGDISYDGSKVVYQQYDYSGCGDDNPEAPGVSLCVQDTTTGQVTTLRPDPLGPGWDDAYGLSSYWYVPLLLSPDGTRLAFSMDNKAQPEPTQSNLYVINTDGTGLHKYTHRGADAPAGHRIAWIPVAWSADGKRLLVNKGMAPASIDSSDQSTSSEVYIFNLATGRHRRIADGYAVDWFEDDCR